MQDSRQSSDLTMSKLHLAFPFTFRGTRHIRPIKRRFPTRLSDWILAVRWTYRRAFSPFPSTAVITFVSPHIRVAILVKASSCSAWMGSTLVFQIHFHSTTICLWWQLWTWRKVTKLTHIWALVQFTMEKPFTIGPNSLAFYLMRTLPCPSQFCNAFLFDRRFILLIIRWTFHICLAIIIIHGQF